MSPNYLYTSQQMNKMDRIAIESRGIPSTLLMSRAAEGIVRQVLSLTGKDRGRAVIFCGPGNNGGDGVAAARLLLIKGWDIRCFLVGQKEKMTEDCQEMERRLEEAGGTLERYHPSFLEDDYDYDVAVDALFGIGLNSNLRGDSIHAVNWMNRLGRVVSSDVPSGIQADTGKILGTAVNASVTVTFSAGKLGLFIGDGAVHSGKVVIHDIGIPEDIINQPSAFVMTPKPDLPRRKRDSHKGNFGRVLIIGGSEGYTGAPVLACRGAVGIGAGLVTLAVPEEIYPIIAVKCDQSMPTPLKEISRIPELCANSDIILVGPGLGLDERAENILVSVLMQLDKPVVVDADGLTLLAKHIDLLDKRRAITILTPHDGEFSRLSGCSLPIDDRLREAREFALAHRCILVLKGYRTITAFPDGHCSINLTGNPGMSKGGAGDVLAGMISGLWPQFPWDSTVPAAVWLHGRAGDLAAEDKGEYGMTIGHLLEKLPYALKECEANN